VLAHRVWSIAWRSSCLSQCFVGSDKVRKNNITESTPAPQERMMLQILIKRAFVRCDGDFVRTVNYGRLRCVYIVVSSGTSNCAVSHGCG
jgi:hypothetical protein